MYLRSGTKLVSPFFMGARQMLPLPINKTLEEIMYKLSFTGAYFLFPESLRIAELFQELGNWEEVKRQVIEENLLQSKKLSTTQKRFNVLRGRIASLNEEQLDLFLNSNSLSQRWLLLLAITKYHRLIREFLEECIRNKFLLFDYQVSDSDFHIFFREKRLSKEQLQTVKDYTEKKIRAVIFNILTDSGILGEASARNIIKPYLDVPIIQAILKDEPALLRVFLYSEADINQLKEQYASSES